MKTTTEQRAELRRMASETRGGTDARCRNCGEACSHCNENTVISEYCESLERERDSLRDALAVTDRANETSRRQRSEYEQLVGIHKKVLKGEIASLTERLTAMMRVATFLRDTLQLAYDDIVQYDEDSPATKEAVLVALGKSAWGSEEG